MLVLKILGKNFQYTKIVYHSLTKSRANNLSTLIDKIWGKLLQLSNTHCHKVHMLAGLRPANNKSLKSWFAGKNFSESKFFIFPQCVVLTQIRFFFRGFIFHEIQFYFLIQIFLDGNEYVSRTDNSNHFYHLFMLEFSTSANTIWNGL